MYEFYLLHIAQKSLAELNSMHIETKNKKKSNRKNKVKKQKNVCQKSTGLKT